jgi:hypothetical protein
MNGRREIRLRWRLLNEAIHVPAGEREQQAHEKC